LLCLLAFGHLPVICRLPVQGENLLSVAFPRLLDLLLQALAFGHLRGDQRLALFAVALKREEGFNLVALLGFLVIAG
jgi:hypothetical protein